MKKVLLLVVTLIALSLVGCSNEINANQGAASGIPFAGYLDIRAAKNDDSIEDVLVIFDYGHDNMYEEHIDYVTKTEFVVYLAYNSNDSVYDLGHSDVQIYKEETIGFYDEENRCTIHSITFYSQNIDFKNNFQLNIDFSDLDFETGRVVFEIREYSELYDTPYAEVHTSLNFKIDNGKISFFR